MSTAPLIRLRLAGRVFRVPLGPGLELSECGDLIEPMVVALVGRRRHVAVAVGILVAVARPVDRPHEQAEEHAGNQAKPKHSPHDGRRVAGLMPPPEEDRLLARTVRCAAEATARLCHVPPNLLATRQTVGHRKRIRTDFATFERHRICAPGTWRFAASDVGR